RADRIARSKRAAGKDAGRADRAVRAAERPAAGDSDDAAEHAVDRENAAIDRRRAGKAGAVAGELQLAGTRLDEATAAGEHAGKGGVAGLVDGKRRRADRQAAAAGKRGHRLVETTEIDGGAGADDEEAVCRKRVLRPGKQRAFIDRRRTR